MGVRKRDVARHAQLLRRVRQRLGGGDGGGEERRGGR